MNLIILIKIIMSSSSVTYIKDSTDDKPVFTKIEGANDDGSARTFITFNHVLFSDYGIKVSVKDILNNSMDEMFKYSTSQFIKYITDELDKDYGESAKIGDVRFFDTIQNIIIDGII